jgi:hypothetical protein
MEKHVHLVGILNIVYRSIVIVGACVLFAIAMMAGHIFDILIRNGAIRSHEVPMELLDIVPIILSVVATVMIIVSVVGIVAAVGVLKHKEWARILLLVISFLNLLRIPLGTVLGVYSIWVLLSDETIRMFSPASVAPAVTPAV